MYATPRRTGRRTSSSTHRRARRTSCVVLYDDTGLASWSPFGGRINMPTLQTPGRQRPDVLAVAHHRAVLADPLLLPHGPQSPRQPMRLDHRGLGRISRRRGAAARGVRHDRTGAAGQRLQHVLAGQEPQRARGGRRRPAAASRSGRWSKGFDRFYGFLGGETNNWYPDLVEDNRFIEQPYSPEEGYHLSKDLADQALEDAARPEVDQPVEALVHVVLSRRQPRAAPRSEGVRRQVQGQVRRRLRGVPRVGAGAHDREGHHAEGHRTHADQSDAGRRRHSPATRCARGTRSTPTRRNCSPAWPRCSPGSPSTPTPRSAASSTTSSRRSSSTTPSSSTAPTTARPARALRTDRSTRTSSSTAIPDELSENMKYLDVLGSPDTYNHYPTGWAVAFRTPFQMFKRYSQYSGGTCDPLVIHWPKGIKAKGEVRHQYHHSTDIVPTISTSPGSRCRRSIAASSSTRSTGVSMRYTLRRRRRPDAEEAAVLRDARHARHLGGRLEGRGRSCADQRQRPFRPGPVGAVPRRRGSLGVEGPRRRASGQAEGADRRLVRGGGQELRAAARRSDARRAARHRASAVRAAARPLHLLSRTRRRCPRASRSTSAAARTRSSPTSTSPSERRRCDLRARLALRRPRAVHQGSRAVLRLQLPRHQARAEVRLARSWSRASTRSAWRSSGRRPASTASRIGKTKLYVDDKVVAEGPMRTQTGNFTLVAATACASATTAATR